MIGQKQPEIVVGIGDRHSERQMLKHGKPQLMHGVVTVPALDLRRHVAKDQHRAETMTVPGRNRRGAAGNPVFLPAAARDQPGAGCEFHPLHGSEHSGHRRFDGLSERIGYGEHNGALKPARLDHFPSGQP
ncbi:hypothetical protein SDC9_153201 [bioreactor metagenome]|uniref:Uncharacterized protein n=1 Tax=bioreactor metagenome TaxID=1076179 RepID=A0A645EVR9_9ZZZZ